MVLENILLKNGFYEGNFEMDKKTGNGKYSSGNMTYEGFFEPDEITGKGKVISVNGTYLGGIVKGMKSGKGIYEYNNGNIYDGEWLNNLKHGEGKLTKKKWWFWIRSLG